MTAVFREDFVEFLLFVLIQPGAPLAIDLIGNTLGCQGQTSLLSEACLTMPP
jgi:hypothetical protein